MAFKIVVLPGDGIGPEVTAQALKLLPIISKKENVEFVVNTRQNLSELWQLTMTMKLK